jgi:Zn ribbon nucleic-acid-binding protein
MKKNLESRTFEFIEKAIKIHGDKYDYSKVEYKNNNIKVCIICRKHGEFNQLPSNHLAGKECLKCSYEKRGKNLTSTNHTFIEKAKIKHGNKYDYSKLIYVNAKIKVCITCPSHGDFYQLPSKHLYGNTCQKCADEIRNLSNIKTNDDFIEESKIKHKNKYCYDKVKYINAKTNIIIICDKHGEFLCTPNNHLRGKGCPKCVGKNKTTEDWIVEAKQKHGEKYSYDRVNYKKCDAKVCISCFEHGDFWQVAQYHLSGNGCPACKQSKLEKEVSSILHRLIIKYERQYNPLFLKKGKGQQTLDFHLPDYNIAIECQGEQHFKPIDFAGKGKDWATLAFEKVKKRDDIKLKKCLANNIEMIYVIDNMEYFDRKYHLDIVEPYSGNVSYHIMHINDLEYHIKRLIDKSNLLS